MNNTEVTQVQVKSNPAPQNLAGNRGMENTGYSYPIAAPKNDLARIRQVLGEQAVLVPFKRGTKMPMNTGWLETTIEQTRNPEYIRSLESNNIAVLVGEKSGGLVTIDFDDEDFMAEFVELNPKLSSESLLTTGYRGCNLWYFIDGDYPATVNYIKELGGASVGEFGGGKRATIVAGVHPKGCEYTMNDLRPLVIRFEDIVWPEGYDYPWMRPAGGAEPHEPKL